MENEKITVKKNNWNNVLIAVGLILTLIAVALINYYLSPMQQVEAQTTPAPTSDKYAQETEDFEPIKKLLLENNLPIDPELILNHALNYETRGLANSRLRQMPEMQDVRQIGNKVEGVQIAGILYLPEKVQLTGTTAIIANKIVFEGTNPIIKGNYPILFYPLVTEGALGTTLETAMREKESVFLKASYSKSSRLKNFVPRLLNKGWTLTIDTSGLGRKEWLENQKLKKEQQFSKISYSNSNTTNITSYSPISTATPGDTSGTPGATGSPVDPGPTGVPGNPSPALSGPPGYCLDESTVNGFPGVIGNEGGTGGDPVDEVGREGGQGGNAAAQNVYIQSASSQALYFYAKGGEGGQGGPGGQGGMGGMGGQGGQGGPGANCSCFRGGAGNGGQGGQAGPGGQGGNGKKGGIGGYGGNGALIEVSVPYDNPAVITSGDGGYGGPGGVGGQPGFPGFPGQGGGGGPGASIPYVCSTSPITSSGATGPSNTNLGYGNGGPIGDSRQNIQSTSVTAQVTRRPPPGGIGGCNQSPPCATGFENHGGICERSFQFQSRCAGMGYDENSCTCPDGINTSPILIDIDGSGFSLTNAANGVNFDILNENFTMRVGWTASSSTNAFLALDRNGNGKIDSGRELFGNVTPQPDPPPGEERQGFLALAKYDKPQQGGNDDGWIDANDSIFTSLRLWQDANHNGISEASELHTLASKGVARIDLDYRESSRTDAHGNRFKYRSRVRDAQGAQVGRWAWDVFLVSEP